MAFRDTDLRPYFFELDLSLLLPEGVQYPHVDELYACGVSKHGVDISKIEVQMVE